MKKLMIFFVLLSALFLLVSCGKDDAGDGRDTKELGECGDMVTSVHFKCIGGGTDMDYHIDGYFSPNTCESFAWYESTRVFNTAEAASAALQEELLVPGTSEVGINGKTVFRRGGAAPVTVDTLAAARAAYAAYDTCEMVPDPHIDIIPVSSGAVSFECDGGAGISYEKLQYLLSRDGFAHTYTTWRNYNTVDAAQSVYQAELLKPGAYSLKVNAMSVQRAEHIEPANTMTTDDVRAIYAGDSRCREVPR